MRGRADRKQQQEAEKAENAASALQKAFRFKLFGKKTERNV